MKKKSLKINKETLANNSISEKQMKSVKGGITPVFTLTPYTTIPISWAICDELA